MVPLLIKLIPLEPLYLYLAASSLAVGAMLVREIGEKQFLVYYVNHNLWGVENRYPNVEKFNYALIIASKKLQHYFQGRLMCIQMKL